MALHKCNNTNEIFNLLWPQKYQKMLYFKQSKDTMMCPLDYLQRSGGPRSVRNPVLINAVAPRICRNPVRKKRNKVDTKNNVIKHTQTIP